MLLKQVEPISNKIRNAGMIKPAKICVIIGLILSILMVIVLIIWIILILAEISLSVLD